jgi:hypothetical protein
VRSGCAKVKTLPGPQAEFATEDAGCIFRHITRGTQLAVYAITSIEDVVEDIVLLGISVKRKNSDFLHAIVPREASCLLTGSRNKGRVLEEALDVSHAIVLPY